MADPDDQLSLSLTTLAGVVLGEHTVDELLTTVVGLARSTVQGADGVSVTLACDGRLTTSHATDDVVRELDCVQYREGAGPCVDAMRTGSTVHFDVARDSPRYPGVADAAQQRFISGVFATPLAVGGHVLGALNCYSSTTASFGAEETAVAVRFAGQASVVLANASTVAEATSTTEQLEQALRSRDLIGQAKGMLMERRRCSADEAFEELRSISQRENKKLTVVAAEVVEGRPDR